MSLQVKLHVLLIASVLGVALYMYLLYKEIRYFEKEFLDIRNRLGVLEEQSYLSCPLVTPGADVQKLEGEPSAAAAATVPPTAGPAEDDDAMSVSSAEIKRLLTNIHDENGELDIMSTQSASLTPPRAPVAPVAGDLGTMNEADLQTQRYDDLRTYARKHGCNVKGSKNDIIKKILELQEQEESSATTTLEVIDEDGENQPTSGSESPA